MLLNKRKTYKKLTDEELILTYKKNKSSLVIGELYNRYAHLVLGTSMKYTKNKHDAEDVTMTVFEKLPVNIEKSEIKYFKSWLYIVTKNEVFQLFRKKGDNSTELTSESENFRIEQNNSIEMIVLKENQLSQLEKQVETLKENQRTCILLFYIERKSYSEISTLMGLKSTQ